MPEYLSPAVYIEEVPGQQPIEAVSTSTTGVVGVTQKGPTAGKPQLVTSYSEFVEKYGGSASKPEGSLQSKWSLGDHSGGHWWDFATSVRGFFDNGGRRLFVKRVLPPGALSSTCTFGPSSIKLVLDGNSQKFESGPPAGSPIPTWSVNFYAKDRGGWSKDKLKVRVQPTLSTQVAAVLRSGAALSGELMTALLPGTLSVDVHSTDVAFKASTSVEVPVRIGRERLLAKFGTASGDKLTLTFSQPPSLSSPIGTTVQRLRPASSPGGGGALKVEVSALKLDGKNLFYDGALVIAAGADRQFTIGAQPTPGPTDPPSVELTPVTTGPLPIIYEGDRLALVEAAVDVEFTVDNSVVTETFTGLGFSPDAIQPFVKTINDSSRLIDAELSDPTMKVTWGAFPCVTPLDYKALAGGDDKLDTLVPADFAGEDQGPGRRTGIKSFEDVEDINICAAPGIWAAAVREELLQHCENLRTRFAVIDPPPGKSVGEILAFRSPISSKYAALYYPWLRVDTVDGEIDLAPSAHIAGLYARVDNDRGVHKAPANEVLRGISGFADDINQREQELLNPLGINALRTFNNRGHRVWGARTLAAESEWRYVNVRRLFINIEESIRRGTQWVVFEPNAEDLWARVRQSVSDFLDIVWRSGALEGLMQTEAFYVKCDRSTMTTADIAAGRLIIEIGIAPVKPAEFVIFRFHQKTRDQVA